MLIILFQKMDTLVVVKSFLFLIYTISVCHGSLMRRHPGNQVTPCIPTHRRSSVNKCGKCIQMDGLSKIGLGTEVAVSKDCANFDGSLCSYDPGVSSRNCTLVELRRIQENKKNLRPENRMKPVQTKTIFINSSCDGIDAPLILTPYIEAGQLQQARDLSRVQFVSSLGLTSYSGFFTVNKTDNGNLFFWLFPAEVAHPEKVPLLIWLQGGPGASSLFGALSGNGPYRVDDNLNLSLHPERWTKLASMLYFENPVNTGFSFTATEDGLSRNIDQVAGNLYRAISQFYTMFPEFLQTELYITGESYAGKYAPAMAYRIHLENTYNKLKLPLTGLILISAYVDPANQPIAQGDQLYQIGIIDRSEKEIFDDYERKWIELINTKKWLEVYSIGSEQFSFFINVTGLQTGDNFLLTNDPIEWFNYDYLMADCDIRQAIHVGNQVFADLSDQVNLFLAEDLGQSMVPTLAFLMNNYRVMLMNGDLDLICSQVSTEKFLNNMDWKRKKEYAAAKKIIWKVQDSDEEVAGYIRQVGEDFVQASVRNSGHEVSFFQPRPTLDLITRFLQRKSF